MARYRQNTVNVFGKSGSRGVNADSTVNSPTYSLRAANVPCRIIPLSTEEAFQAGTLDWGNKQARIYFDLSSITTLTHNDLVQDETGDVWRVINEPERHTFGTPHWETIVSNVSVPAEGIEFYAPPTEGG